MRKLLILPVIAFFLAACVSGPMGATQLTAEEVRTTFIDRPFTTDNGRFIFRSDGTYHYTEDRSTGAWSWDGRYEMNDEGVLEGSTTNYTFYRNEDGSYQYYHSRSGKYYPAYPS